MAHGAHFWKKVPFLKLLISLIAGIIVQWHFQINTGLWWFLLSFGIAGIIGFFLIPFFNRYKLSFVNGIVTIAVFVSAGALLTWHKDIRNNKAWFGNVYKETDALIVTLNEPPAEKTKSIKANATVNYLLRNNKLIPVEGTIILYIKKELPSGEAENLLKDLHYGSQVIIKKPLQEIKNSGNPGGFDYKRYCLFQGITHQVFLKTDEFEALNTTKEKWLDKFLYNTRDKVLGILQKNIKSAKELGLAEALLIGYKDDLEQSLVQSYTNTGVVHIIAISGLHLGLIYWLLVQLMKPLQRYKKIKWIGPVCIITGLWLFSLLAGANPSVLRSALMFTCIVVGEAIGRKSSIYNTMAVSAFILLCYNPFWLWDVGFQLSYAAVLSIIIFMRPVYNWFYIKNKLLDFWWKLNAVSIAAQMLTLPLSIYHFHQFPNFFLLTNFLAVPLSSAILLGEILLCTVSFIPALAALTGKTLTWFIWLMNSYIEKVESMPSSLWDGLYITIGQTIVLYLFVTAVSYWLMEKSKTGLKVALLAAFIFISLRSFSFLQAANQQKIIVYNVPQKRAIDFINGRNYFFVGDSDLVADDFARNFHLKPSRVLYRIKAEDLLSNFSGDGSYIIYRGKHILLLDKSRSFVPGRNKPVIDLLVISKNPKLNMQELSGALNLKQVVFDGSAPAWKVKRWKKDCDSLQIPSYDVTLNGAFEMNIN